MKYIAFILDDICLDDLIDSGGIQDNSGNILGIVQVRNWDFYPDLTHEVQSAAKFLYKSNDCLIGENISIKYDGDDDSIAYHIVALDGKIMLGRMIISDDENELVHLKLKSESMVLKKTHDQEGYMDRGVKYYLTARNNTIKYINASDIEPIRLHDKADDEEQERLRQFYETCIY